MFVVVCVCCLTPPAGKAKLLYRSPGLVAVLCIFVIILALLLVIGLTKGLTSSNSKFERLEEVPMVSLQKHSELLKENKQCYAQSYIINRAI